MNPLPAMLMAAFLRWVAEAHPEIRSLRHLERDKLLGLIAEFGGDQRFSASYWISSFSYLESDGDRGGYDKVRKLADQLFPARRPGEELMESFRARDRHRERMLERYLEVPLHGVFLYSSEDDVFASYITEHWSALDRLSAHYCDLYPSLAQLRGDEDVYSLHDSISDLFAVRKIGLEELPGIVFFDGWRASEYISFQGRSAEQTTKAFRTIFGTIRSDPSMRGVNAAKERLEPIVTEPGSGPVFHQHIYGGVGAQGVNVTQNVGIQPEQLAALSSDLRALAPNLPASDQDEFLQDVEVLEDAEQAPEKRATAGKRIRAAVTSGGTKVAAAAVIAGLDKVVGIISGM